MAELNTGDGGGKKAVARLGVKNKTPKLTLQQWWIWHSY